MIRSKALLEYALAMGFALLIAVIVFAIAVNLAIYCGKLVASETKAVVEELEKMRTSLKK